LKVKTMSL